MSNKCGTNMDTKIHFFTEPFVLIANGSTGISPQLRKDFNKLRPKIQWVIVSTHPIHLNSIWLLNRFHLVYWHRINEYLYNRIFIVMSINHIEFVTRLF